VYIGPRLSDQKPKAMRFRKQSGRRKRKTGTIKKLRKGRIWRLR